MTKARIEDETLNRYFDGDLTPDEAAAIQRELAASPDSVERLSSLQRLHDLIATSAEQVASEVDFDAMFSRIERGAQAAPAPGLLERLTLWVSESLQHNPLRVWAPAGGLALAAAVLIFVLARSGEGGAPGEAAPEMAGRGIIEEGREPKRERMMIAEGSQQKVEPTTLEGSNASEVVQVDFGSNTGTVFEIALADGASTPVVWINDEE